MRLVAQHARARTGRGNDRGIAVHAAQVVGQLRDVLARILVQAVGLQRQAAAAVLGNQDLVTQVLEDHHGVDGGLDLEVLAGAAMEEDHLAARARAGQRLVLLEPGLEGTPVGARHGSRAMHTNNGLHRHADRLDIQRPVRNRGDRGHHGADQ